MSEPIVPVSRPIRNSKLFNALVFFGSNVGTRLAEKEAAGYTGWDDPKRYDHIEDGMWNDAHEILCNPDMPVEVKQSKLVDIAARCMMLHYQLQTGGGNG